MKETEYSGLIGDVREEQRLAICSRDPLIVVSAGAGTGKTHTLARRFAWLLASDPECCVDQILTLTFTQLAATEMRERIRDTLKAWYSADMPHLRDAIDRLDEAYISTIHSFALRVIRESGLELDLDPRSTIVNAPSEREFWHDLRWSIETRAAERMPGRMSDEWNLYAMSMRDDPAYTDFFNYFGATLLANLGRDACELFGSMNLHPEEIRDFDPGLESAAQERVASFLSDKWDSAWDTWQHGVFPAIEQILVGVGTSRLVDSLRTLWEKWREKPRSDEARRGFFVDLISNALANLTGGRDLKRLIEQELGESLKKWRDDRRGDAEVTATLFVSPPYNEEERRVRKLLLGSAAVSWECWNSARQERGVLTFSDLVRYAGMVLAASKSYAGRFRHIMVDEFQDTDELQDNMIGALARAWPASNEPGGEINRTLFIVGDIKQSIYRFRHANPKLLARYIGNAAKTRHIPLSHSYRMSGRMMDGINMFFGHVWRRGVVDDGDAHVKYEPLRPPTDAAWWKKRNGSEAPASPIEILLYSHAADDENDANDTEASTKKGEKTRESAKSMRHALAAGIALRLKEMVNRRDAVWDKRNLDFRPLRWRDITLLVPTRTSYRDIETAFALSDVPVIFGSSREYFNRGEVRDIVGLLRLLDTPDDEVSLAGWIESPFSGMSPGAALQLAETARCNGTALLEEFSARYPNFAQRVSQLRIKARLIGPSEALCSLLEDDSWLSSYSGESRVRARTNVRAAIDMVREYEGSFGRNLSACAHYLEREMTCGEEVSEPDTSGEDIDAVRVMTIHASKGLEFPAVVIMGMEASSRRRGIGRASVSKSLGVVANHLPDGSSSVTAKWHSAIERAEEMEESVRLLYVAMTRAQDYLLCCGVLNRSRAAGDDWLSLLLEANEANGNPLPTTIITGAALELTARRSAEPMAAHVRADAASSDDRHFTPRLARMSASAYSLISWCPVAYRIRYRQGRELKWEMPDGDGYGGSDLGSVAHWTLSRWDFDSETISDYLPIKNGTSLEEMLREIPPYLRHVYSSYSNRKILREWLGRFASTDECREMMELNKKGSLRRELAFSIPHAGTNLVGSIDVYWEDERGSHIRDWKITPEQSAPHELYRAQILYYSMACHIARPGHEVDAGIIFLRHTKDDMTLSFEVEKIDDWDDISKNISKAAETALKGPFERAADRCESCPFKHDCQEFSPSMI
ncbi:MAG: UvrD-helicase domain-containing protein [Synergistaceae bacterium]|jgi:ATP-dependent exoDNAse (exonuclease V) beta subunit|nr:UvrD-helicase domain-containing protein [Synergistaceae bacterium]